MQSIMAAAVSQYTVYKTVFNINITIITSREAAGILLSLLFRGRERGRNAYVMQGRFTKISHE
jgi:hypothetical protein